MSKELIGANNRAVGSRDYFNKINKDALVGMLMYDKSRCDYYDTLRDAGSKIQSMIYEIYSDVKNNIGIVRYIPAGNRESLIKTITGLSDLYKIANSSLTSADNCISILRLSDSGTRLKSGASEREIEDAVRILENGGKSSLSRYDRVYIVKKAAEGGVESALGSDKKKGDFYREITARQRNPRAFLGEVLLAYQYKSSPRDYNGKYGKELCSKEYLSYIEKKIFGKEIEGQFLTGEKAYGESVRRSLKTIKEAVEKDLGTGERNNDYIKDENGKRLNEFIDNLSRCGVSDTYRLKSDVEKLCWYVGGSEYRIRELQRKLNELGVRDSSGARLKEDGVYGKKTLSAWESFISNITHGAHPIMTYVDPLQTQLTGVTSKVETITISATKYAHNPVVLKNIPQSFSRFSLNEYDFVTGDPGEALYYLDVPHLGTSDLHINIKPEIPKFLQDHNILKDHKAISESTFLKYVDLTDTIKKVKVAGRTLAIAGAALDVIQLGMAVEDDLHDADRKLGKKTAKAAFEIGGRWAGAAAGAEGGAIVGATLGSIVPGIGTAIGGAFGGLAGGIFGAWGGGEMGKYIVDVTYLND